MTETYECADCGIEREMNDLSDLPTFGCDEGDGDAHRWRAA